MFLLKLVISVSLVYITIKDIEYEKINRILLDIDIKFLILALVLQFILSLLQTYRWQQIANFLKLRLNFLYAWNNVLIGSFFNQTLPSSIGGDAVRILLLSKYGFRISFKTIAIDRIFALLANALICIIGFFFLNSKFVEISIYFNFIFLISLTLIIVIFISVQFASYIKIFNIDLFLKKIGLISLLNTFKLVFLNIKLSFFTFLYSIIIQLIVALSGLLILKSMSINVDYFIFTILFISVLLVSTIPISIAGWGVRENLMVVMMSGIGLNQEISLTLSIIFGLVMLIVGLPGGILLMNKKISSQIRITDFFKKFKKGN